MEGVQVLSEGWSHLLPLHLPYTLVSLFLSPHLAPPPPPLLHPPLLPTTPLAAVPLPPWASLSLVPNQTHVAYISSLVACLRPISISCPGFRPIAAWSSSWFNRGPITILAWDWAKGRVTPTPPLLHPQLFTPPTAMVIPPPSPSSSNSSCPPTPCPTPTVILTPTIRSTLPPSRHPSAALTSRASQSSPPIR